MGGRLVETHPDRPLVVVVEQQDHAAVEVTPVPGIARDQQLPCSWFARNHVSIVPKEFGPVATVPLVLLLHQASGRPVPEGSFESTEKAVDDRPSVFLRTSEVHPAQTGRIDVAEPAPQRIVVPPLLAGIEEVLKCVDVPSSRPHSQLQHRHRLPAGLTEGECPGTGMGGDMVEVDDERLPDPVPDAGITSQRPDRLPLTFHQRLDGAVDHLGVEPLLAIEVAVHQRTGTLCRLGDLRHRDLRVGTGSEQFPRRVEDRSSPGVRRQAEALLPVRANHVAIIALLKYDH